MNEEQSEKLIDILSEIKEILKPKQTIEYIQKEIRPEKLEKLKFFKEQIIFGNFFGGLNEEQKQYILNIDNEYKRIKKWITKKEN